MRRGIGHAVAALVVEIAAAILPGSMRHWGQAMRDEVAAIDRPGDAIGFAVGCLGCALGESAGVQDQQSLSASQGDQMMMARKSLLHHPRGLGALCAVGATGLGLAYMSLAGAPTRYLAMNSGALVLGLLILGGIVASARTIRVPVGVAGIMLGTVILATALFGTMAEGATRWLMISGVAIQPSLIVLPVLVVSFARSRDALSTIGILIAAAGLAVQPDRAMAGALVAGLAVLAAMRPPRNVAIALAGAAAGFAVTLWQADVQLAMPYVDQIFYSSFAVHPLAGAAVLAGSVLMIVPALNGVVRDAGHREAYTAFGILWVAISVAAALGNYPTPLVGYGGSAIVGYLVSLAGFPAGRTAESIVTAEPEARSEAGEPPTQLQTAAG